LRFLSAQRARRRLMTRRGKRGRRGRRGAAGRKRRRRRRRTTTMNKRLRLAQQR
jgi:hypothetical protein